MAKLAGVSPSTVSHVLNKTRFVAPETERKVLEAIKLLSYKKHSPFAALQDQKLRVIGFIIPQIHNVFWLRIIRSLEFHLSQYGYHLFLGCSYGNPEREVELVETMRQSGIEGVIVATCLNSLETDLPSVFREELLRFLSEQAVFLDTAPLNSDLDFVGVNNEESAYRLTNLLIEAGCKKLGMINGEPTMLTARERAAGFWQAVREKNCEVREEHIFLGKGLSKKVGIEGGKKFLSLLDPPTGLFLASGNITVGFLEALRNKKITLENGPCIVGFDDIEWTPTIEPFLTCAVQPAWDMGEEAVSLLLDKLNGDRRGAAREVRLKCEILVRRLWQKERKDKSDESKD